MFDAPKASEWRAFRSVPRAARFYNSLLVLAAAAVTVGSTVAARLRWPDVAALAVLSAGAVANVELGRLAEGGRVDRHRIHKGLSAWPFAAALVLGPGLAGWVAAVGYVHARSRGMRITLWKWVGSWAIVTLAALAAGATLDLAANGRLPADGAPATLGHVLAAVVAFLAVESALFYGISRLNAAADEVYLRAMLGGREFYVIEFMVLVSGALAAVVYRYSPGFLLLAGPSCMLMQRGLLHQPLRHEASHDAKTGVLHSGAWHSAAAAAYTRARRDGQRVAVLIIDIDHFKAVNDTLGHVVGDEVLVRTADAVEACLRRTDVVGRFGGDEFCALLIGALDEAVAAGERIRAEVAERVSEPGHRVTVSVGVAVDDPASDGGLSTLVTEADLALYEAKSAGRDRVCLHEVPPAPAVEGRRTA